MTALLLCGLLAYFVWFLRTRMQSVQAQTRIQSEVQALNAKDTKRARDLFEMSVRENRAVPAVYADICQVCLAFDQPALTLEYAQRGLEACKDAAPEKRSGLYLFVAQADSMLEPAHPQTKAIAAARQALSLEPQNPSLQNALGYMLLDNDQNLDEAEKLVRQSLAALKSPGDDPLSDDLRPAVQDSFGWLLYKKGDYAGAVAALTEVLHTMPAGLPGYIAKYYYYHLGAAYRKAGNIEQARRTLAIALQYDPVFPEAKAEVALLPPVNPPAASPSGFPQKAPSSTPGLKL